MTEREANQIYSHVIAKAFEHCIFWNREVQMVLEFVKQAIGNQLQESVTESKDDKV